MVRGSNPQVAYFGPLRIICSWKKFWHRHKDRQQLCVTSGQTRHVSDTQAGQRKEPRFQWGVRSWFCCEDPIVPHDQTHQVWLYLSVWERTCLWNPWIYVENNHNQTRHERSLNTWIWAQVTKFSAMTNLRIQFVLSAQTSEEPNAKVCTPIVASCAQFGACRELCLWSLRSSIEVKFLVSATNKTLPETAK